MKTGLQRFLEQPRHWLRGRRVGLVTNPTAVDASLADAVDLLHSHADVDLRLLLGPEHGLLSTAQDMKGVSDARDPFTGLPVVSLYGDNEASLSPKPEQLALIDLLIFDIQDIGSRYYTYAATLALCMRAAKTAGVGVLVLDRPNPIDGEHIEGGGLQEGLESFVGLYPVPHRHGMTVGELARLYNGTFAIGCELEVVACEGWARQQFFDDTGLPWIMPSPNMPTLDTAIVYPGMCLLEGTNLSEARGTTRPFELCGAPFVDGRALATELGRLHLPGVKFRPCCFEPAFHKHQGQSCGGVQLHVTDRAAFLPYRTGLAALWAAHKLYPNDFAWRTETYEFRDDVPAIDLLTGQPSVRVAIDAVETFEQVVQKALQGTEAYHKGRDTALLY